MRGSHKKNPQRGRARKREPKPKLGIGRPPSHFDAEQKARWKELVKIVPDGVLTVMDRPAVEGFCVLWAQLRRDRTLSGTEWAQFTRLMSLFGMTPADRSKVAVRDADDNPTQEEAYFKRA